MKKERKSRAFNPRYESPLQLELGGGFETPFSKALNPRNRWVVLAGWKKRSITPHENGSYPFTVCLDHTAKVH